MEPDPYENPEFMRELARTALEEYLEVLSPGSPAENANLILNLMGTIDDMYEEVE